MKLQEFFKKYIHLEELEELLMRHGLATDGSEDEMIDRLLAEPSFELDEILSVLYREDFQEICKALTLPYSYNKDELWEMIKEQLGLPYEWYRYQLELSTKEEEHQAPPQKVIQKGEAHPVLLQKAVQEDKTIPWWRDFISKITIRVVAGIISGLIVTILLLILGLS